MADLLNAMSSAGYERVVQVTTRGQFAVRGGIVDLYSWQAPLPVRVEFFGDMVESLREFDVDTQTSVRDLGKIDVRSGVKVEHQPTAHPARHATRISYNTRNPNSTIVTRHP